MSIKLPNIYGTHSGGWEFSASHRACYKDEWAAYWLGNAYDVQGATEYHPGFLFAIREAINEKPEIVSANISFDGPRVPLYSISLFVPPPLGEMVWLHGTSQAAWNRIQYEGLLPRACSGVSAAYGASKYSCAAGNPKLIYLTSQRNMAGFAARDSSRVTKTSPLILSVVGLDPSMMFPDEDSAQSTAQMSLWTLGSIGYGAPIAPNKIKLAYVLDSDNNWQLAG